VAEQNFVTLILLLGFASRVSAFEHGLLEVIQKSRKRLTQ